MTLFQALKTKLPLKVIDNNGGVKELVFFYQHGYIGGYMAIRPSRYIPGHLVDRTEYKRKDWQVIK